jgi:predicted N-formylglutamate amidohydrolase
MSNSQPQAGAVLPSLLAADEPAPFESVNAAGAAPLLLICDHAAAFIPRALGGLGLDEAQLRRHIALDIGAAEVTRLLAGRLDAPAVLSRFSRLVIDPNRTFEAPSLIPVRSDGIEVPGNRDLLPAAREARIRTFHQPYHEAVAARLDALVAAQAASGPPPPAVVSVHSFTPVMDGQERPWQVGILWNRDGRLALPLMARLRALGLEVGDNLPYSGRAIFGYSLQRHAEARRLPHVLVELRQDLIDTRQGAEEWAGLLAAALQEALLDPGVCDRLPDDPAGS